MTRRLDLRTLFLLLSALVLGVAWAAFNLAATGGVRNDSVVRALVWVVFAAPFALWLGWLAARRHELGLASFACFCLYFFTFFVAQRIESLVVSSEAAAANGHTLYFTLVIVIHTISGVSLAVWRALTPPLVAPEPGTVL